MATINQKLEMAIAQMRIELGDTNAYFNYLKKTTQMEKIKIVTGIEITTQDVDDIMVTAFEGGINYWASSQTIIQKPDDAEYASDVISRGGVNRIFVPDYDKPYYDIDIAKFIKGCQLYLAKYKSFDTETLDANMADEIIQFAIFGKQIFG